MNWAHYKHLSWCGCVSKSVCVCKSVHVSVGVCVSVFLRVCGCVYVCVCVCVASLGLCTCVCVCYSGRVWEFLHVCVCVCVFHSFCPGLSWFTVRIFGASLATSPCFFSSRTHSSKAFWESESVSVSRPACSPEACLSDRWQNVISERSQTDMHSKRHIFRCINVFTLSQMSS